MQNKDTNTKTISKFDFTKDKFVVLNEEEHLVLELETGEQYIATPLDIPEEEVLLQSPIRYMEVQEKLFKQAEEFAPKFQRMINGDKKYKTSNKNNKEIEK